MKSRLLLSASILAVAACAFARTDDSLFSTREMREQAAEAAPAAPDASIAVEAEDASGCANPNLDGAVLGRGIFRSAFQVEKNGVNVGKLAPAGDGWTFTGPGGAMIASGKMSPMERGRKLTVSDCNGAAIGEIIELDAERWEDGSSYTLADASGSKIAGSGYSTDDVVLAGASGDKIGESTSVSSFGDKYKLSIGSGADSRLMAMAAVMQNAAAYRRASERRREMPHEPHGRSDR